MKNAIQLRKLFVQTISAVLIFISFPSRTFALSQTDQVQQNDEISTQVQAFGIDAGYEAQWGLQIIHANEVWSVSTGRNVLVAVVDSGSGPNADLTANLSPGRSIIRGRSNDGGNDVDPNGHGTHVAGIIAAQANNDIGDLEQDPGGNRGIGHGGRDSDDLLDELLHPTGKAIRHGRGGGKRARADCSGG